MLSTQDLRGRQSELAAHFASDFDATLLHNRVHERVGEDNETEHIFDAAVDVARVRDVRRDRLGDGSEFGDSSPAVARLSYVGRQRALEVVAETCAEVLTEATEWTDAWDPEAIEAARIEAARWLQHQTNAASRAGVLDVLADYSDDPRMDIALGDSA